jgi:hypothetical protein
MSDSSLIWGMVWGTIGSGYLIYGAKQKKGVALISAIALMVFPYFVSNVFLTIILGLAFMALPFYIQY